MFNVFIVIRVSKPQYLVEGQSFVFLKTGVDIGASSLQNGLLNFQAQELSLHTCGRGQGFELDSHTGDFTMLFWKG